MPIRSIKAGETLPQVAAEEGFGDLDKIWNHPNNADLKKRRDPCVLAPGDQLFVPDRELVKLDLATMKRHKVVVKRPKLSLIVVLQNSSGAPLAGVSGTLTCDGTPFPVSADGDGRVTQDIPIDTEFAELALDAPAAAQDAGADGEQAGDLDNAGAEEDNDAAKIGMLVGHLGPLDTAAGWRARLANLGYPVEIPSGDAGAAPAQEAEDEEEDPSLRLAIEEFQCEHDLPVNGERDAATEAKLLEIHGS